MLVGFGKFVKGLVGDFNDYVIKGWFKFGVGCFGDWVFDFVEG